MIAEKFEDNLPQILAAAGYSTKIALQKINDASIDKIETFVQENVAKFKDIIKDTRYEGTTPFRFLPGHRDIIVALPKIILEAETKKSRKNKDTTSIKIIHTSIDQNKLNVIKKKINR